MSEETKKPRSLADINNEYTALCAQAGQRYYQLQCAQEDLAALNKAIRKVNLEAAEAKKYEDEQAVAKSSESNVTKLDFEGAKANA